MTTDAEPAGNVLWERSPQFDRRFAHGDDYAGDGWRHVETGELRWTVVGIDMNKAHAEQVFVFDE